MRLLVSNRGWSIVLTMLLIAILTACGQQTAAPGAPMAAGDANEMTLFVGSQMVECTGVAPQMCLQVKESPEAEYELFYDTIEGFTFEPGYTYELRVLRTPVDNPPADAPAFTWTLIEEVNKMLAETTLTDTTWQLVSYTNAAGETVEVLPDSEVTALFQQGQVVGSAGCNRYFGSATVDGNNLTIEGSGATMMACEPPELMQQEMDFLAALNNAATYQLSDDQLTMMNAEGQTILTFAVLQPMALTGTNWQLNSFNTGDALVSVLEGSEITALFGDDGSLAGSAGCNRYTSTYTVTDTVMTISPAATTRMACAEPAGIMEQEQAYLTALQSTASFQIQGGQLELFNAENTRVAIFMAAAPGTGEDVPPTEGEQVPPTEGEQVPPTEGEQVPPAEGEQVPPAEGTSSQEITGVTWQWQQFLGNDGTTITVDNPASYTLQFQPDGQVQVQADCNTALGTYTRTDNQLTFAMGPMTLAACPEGSLSDEYLARLNQVSSFLFDGNDLILELQLDTGSLRFVRG